MFEKLNRAEATAFDVISIALLLFYTYSAIISPASTEYHRGVYVLCTYVLVFLLYRSSNQWLRYLDYFLIMASIFTIGYWIRNFEAINYRIGAETNLDQVVAVVGVLISVELARRVVGWVFVVLGIVMLVYGVYGHLAPELISHAGDSFPNLCTTIFYKSDGIFGIMPNILASYVILFIFFGAYLEKCGAQKFFVDFPLAAVGNRPGGPAKVAIVASGVFGSISGSAIANTVSTGAFTIPMMKKAGFKPHVAGGIEPAASIGGMFMPPIMGAGGFIMAELTGEPYSTIMLVSLFPALMYFFSVFCMVHFEAIRQNIGGLEQETDSWTIFKSGWYYTLPLIIITVFMFSGFSPAYSAVLGLITCVALGALRKDTYIDPSLAIVLSMLLLGKHMEFPVSVSIVLGVVFIGVLLLWFRKQSRLGFRHFVEATRKGTENGLLIGATVGVIGIIIGVLTHSGLVLTIADIIIGLADGSLILTIILIAVASLVLGMGVPVTAAYLITAVVAVPALTELGVNPLASHMIVYWLSQDSNVTPPVCIAAFAGATIAKANMWWTAVAALKFAKFLYVAPFLFGFVPAFSLQGSYLDIIKAFLLIILGTYLFAWIMSGLWIKQISHFYTYCTQLITNIRA